MSINIWTDSMQHAALLGKPVLFTNWLIQRDIIPDGWYCYDLRGTHKSPSTRTTLVDHAADYADKQELEESIIRRHYGTIVMDSEQPQGGGTSAGGMAQGIQAAPDSRKTVFRP